MAYYGQGTSDYKEMVVPAILILLVILVVAAKMLQMCWIPVIGPALCGSGTVSRTLILTTPENYEEASDFGKYINTKVTRTNPVVNEDIPYVSEGYLTSSNYDIVILYGGKTALTTQARDELTSYVQKGGNLMIVKGAGIKGLKSDGVTITPYIFGWQADDMGSIISFSPGCPVENCDSVNDITVTASQMNDVRLVPTKWEHPIVSRMGINSPISLETSQYSEFSGVVEVVDEQNQKVMKISWKDGEGDVHSAPAVITYKAGATGGKVTYLGYNPQELEQETLFRNIFLHTIGEI